jgi:hypothetical protein
MKKEQEQFVFDRTKKGNEVLKIVRLMEKFRKDYPRNPSKSLEFVGIYDDKAVMRILNKIMKEGVHKGEIDILRPRQEIRTFAEAMEVVMRKHDKEKGESWKNMTFEELQDLMLTEVEETKYKDAKLHEWIDVANLCMMIYANTVTMRPEELKEHIKILNQYRKK